MSGYYWLDRLGGLRMGIKFYGDTELSRDEWRGLEAYAPEHRVDALEFVRLQPEFDQLAAANNDAVIAEVIAHDAADKAADDAIAADPSQAAAMVERATKLREVAESASAATAALQPRLAELREKFAHAPPKRYAALV